MEKFELSQQLNRRQFRWASELSQFNFKIVHRPGKLMVVPDALSRKTEYTDIFKKKNFLQLFRRVSEEEINTLNFRKKQLNPLRIFTITTNASINIATTSTTSTTSTFDFATEFLQKLQQEKSLPPKSILQHQSYHYNNNLHHVYNKIYITSTTQQLEIIKTRHNQPTAGHFGILKTYYLVKRNYYWVGMKKDVVNFIKGCHICTRNKSVKHLPYGLLQPLPIPEARWTSVSMDFITDLPVSQKFDSIFVVKDRLTKNAHFIPCRKNITAEQTADLFVKEVFRLHGVPKDLVSDRGPQFKSKFFRKFFQTLGSSTKLSTTAHPETDGSTEIINQVIEQYIRIFGNAHQSDWVNQLPLAEFTYNNTINSTTQLTPFFANLGYHPIMDFHDISNDNPAATDKTKHLQDILLQLKTNLKHAQHQYTTQANKRRQQQPESIKVGQSVFLNRKNISPKFGIKKLTQKFFGPFEIIEQINPVTFRLKLPPSLPIHPVFHVSLLETSNLEYYPGQNETAQPILVDGEEEWEVETLLKKRVSGKGKKKKISYLVRWKGRDQSDDCWEPLKNLGNCKDLVTTFSLNHNM